LKISQQPTTSASLRSDRLTPLNGGFKLRSKQQPPQNPPQQQQPPQNPPQQTATIHVYSTVNSFLMMSLLLRIEKTFYAVHICFIS